MLLCTLNKMSKFDFILQGWTTFSTVPQTRKGSAIAVKDNHIYCFGGNNQSKSHEDTAVYDILKDEWTTIPFVIDVWRCAYVQIKNSLYLIGGLSSSQKSKQTGLVRKIDLNTLTIEELQALTLMRSGVSALAIAEKNFIITGGRSDKAREKIVEQYSIESNSFISLPSMINGRHCHSSVFHSSMQSIFVIGGFNSRGMNDKLVEMYDVRTSQWQSKASLNRNRVMSTALLHKDQIYVFAGAPSGKPNAERYDIKMDKWEFIPDTEHLSVTQFGVLCKNPDY